VTSAAGIPTPFYVFDLDRFDAKHRMLRGAFAARFPRLELGYSYKTAWLPAFCRRAQELGAFAEVVSRMEFELAMRLGVPPSRVLYNGPAKRSEDVALALKAGARLHLDSTEEARHAAEIARGCATPPSVGLRIALADAGATSRFGLSVEDGELAEALRILRPAGIRVAGLHVHASGRSRDLAGFSARARVLADAALEVGIDELDWIDLGGGLGFAPPEMPGLVYPDFASVAGALHAELARALGPALARLEVFVEPGIAWVGDCAELFAGVDALKRRGSREIAVLDVGIHDVKPSRHPHNHPTQGLDADHQPLAGPLRRYDLAGYTCMEDDWVARDLELPRLAPGCVLRIGNVGAYTFVFKPRFIRGAPAMFVRRAGELRRVRAAEGLGDFAVGHEL
jgi:diaminopimelate decarboxylase